MVMNPSAMSGFRLCLSSFLSWTVRSRTPQRKTDGVSQIKSWFDAGLTGKTTWSTVKSFRKRPQPQAEPAPPQRHYPKRCALCPAVLLPQREPQRLLRIRKKHLKHRVRHIEWPRTLMQSPQAKKSLRIRKKQKRQTMVPPVTHLKRPRKRSQSLRDRLQRKRMRKMIPTRSGAFPGLKSRQSRKPKPEGCLIARLPGFRNLPVVSLNETMTTTGKLIPALHLTSNGCWIRWLRKPLAPLWKMSGSGSLTMLHREYPTVTSTAEFMSV